MAAKVYHWVCMEVCKPVETKGNMRTKQLYAAVGLAALLIALPLFSGCATANPENRSEHDSRTARGLLDSMASPVHTFPANVPR